MRPSVYRQLILNSCPAPRRISINPYAFLRSASSNTPQSNLTTDPQRSPSHASKYYNTPQKPPSTASPHPSAARVTPPPNETPAQKVARLRAARNAQKAAQFSLWDRTVVRGREIVDSIHRWFVRFLIGTTVVIAIGATFTVGNMMLYNRRKRDAWYKDQMNAYHAALGEAVSRANQGLSLDEDQILLLNNLKAKSAVEERRKKEGGFIKKSWRSLVSAAGLKTDEGEGEGNGEDEEVDEDAPRGAMGAMVELGRMDRGDADEFEIIRRIQDKKMLREKGIEGEPMAPVEKIERENMGELVPEAVVRVPGEERIGGPLDQMAERVVEDGGRKISHLGRGDR